LKGIPILDFLKAAECVSKESLSLLRSHFAARPIEKMDELNIFCI
jgi:hypothetical protein